MTENPSFLELARQVDLALAAYRDAVAATAEAEGNTNTCRQNERRALKVLNEATAVMCKAHPELGMQATPTDQESTA